MIKMPNKVEYIKFKNFERKIEPPFMIYADFCKKYFRKYFDTKR